MEFAGEPGRLRGVKFVEGGEVDVGVAAELPAEMEAEEARGGDDGDRGERLTGLGSADGRGQLGFERGLKRAEEKFAWHRHRKVVSARHRR